MCCKSAAIVFRSRMQCFHDIPFFEPSHMLSPGSAHFGRTLVTPAHVARPLAPAHPLLLPLHHPLQALRHLHHPLPHRHCLCPWRGARGQPGEFFWELIRDPSQQWLLGKDGGPAQTFGEMCQKLLNGKRTYWLWIASIKKLLHCRTSQKSPWQGQKKWEIQIWKIFSQGGSKLIHR